MTSKAQASGGRWSRWRIAGWSIATLMLLLPAVAMQLTSEVNWDETDFIFAALLIGTVGGLYELTVRTTRNWAHRAGIAAALAASFLIVWANGAVGMIGSEDNPYNLLFLGVILVAFIGAIAVRFRPAGLALVMIVAGVGHAVIAGGGLSADPRGGLFSLVFAGLWLLAAALFRAAAQSRSAGGV